MSALKDIREAILQQGLVGAEAIRRGDALIRIANSNKIPLTYMEEAKSLADAAASEAEAIWETRDKLKLLLRALESEAPRDTWCQIWNDPKKPPIIVKVPGYVEGYGEYVFNCVTYRNVQPLTEDTAGLFDRLFTRP